MTSGGVLLVSAVVSFSWMPPHFWTSYLTVTSLFESWNSLFKASVSVVGAEPSISQTVRVFGPLDSAAVLPDGLVPHPATVTASAAAPTASPLQPFTFPPFQKPGRTSTGTSQVV